MQRNYKMDNIRFLLIFLVILGHFMELFPGNFTTALYKIIYSFHMPAFLFLTGCFARFKPRKIVFKLICPYILFQILYRAFDAFILRGKTTFTPNFTTPYWLLWYLFTVICYYLLIPVIDTKSMRSRRIIIGLSILLCLLTGYDSSIGYYLSLSRSITFLPYFIAGYYWSKTKIAIPQKFRFIPITGFLFLLNLYIINSPMITNKVLYSSYSYEKAGHNPLIRMLLLLCAFTWIFLLLYVIPNKKLPFITNLGQNTLSVFLLHGFIVKLAKHHALFIYSEPANLLLAISLSLIIILLFGNPLIAGLFRRPFKPH